MRSRIAALSVSPARFEPADHLGRHVEPARLEHQRHHREPGEQIVRRRHRRLPQPVMRRQFAVIAAERPEPAAQQREMLGLLGGDPDPIVVELSRQSLTGISRDDVPAEVDRIQFDMSQRVDQRDPPADGAEIAPLRHVARRKQHRPLRPGRARLAQPRCPTGIAPSRQRAASAGSAPPSPSGRQPRRTRRRRAGRSPHARERPSPCGRAARRQRGGRGRGSERLRRLQHLGDVARHLDLVPDAAHRRRPCRSGRCCGRCPCICGRTCSFRPRRRISRRPRRSSSEARVKGSSYFFLNLSCEATESLRDADHRRRRSRRNPGSESRNPQASAVQPEVSSLG